MKTRSVVHVLSILLLVALLCAIAPAAFAEGGNHHGPRQADPSALSAPESAAAATKEQLLVDYISCIMAADKAQSRDAQEAYLAEAEGLWYVYSDMLRSQWVEEPAAEKLAYAEPSVQAPASAEDPEYMRQQMLTYFLLYMDAAEKEQNPEARNALYLEAQQLWNIYMSMVLAPEDPYAMPQERTAAVEMDPVELRQQTLTYYLLYLDAAEKAVDPQVKAELAAEAEELLDIYLNLMYEDEMPTMTTEAAAVEMDPDFIRTNLLYYYLQFVNAAKYERDPYAKAELAAEAEELWNLYIDMVISCLQQEADMQNQTAAIDPVELRPGLLTYYLLYAEAADEASDPYVKEQLSNEAEKLWNTYLYTVFTMNDQESNQCASQSKPDIYLDNAAPDISQSEPAPVIQPDAQPVIGLPNPWTMTNSREEAEMISGIELRLPADEQMPRGFVLKNYRAMDGTIEADYSNGEEYMVLRASVNEEGYYLSGDYNKYSRQWEENVKGLRVDCLGDGAKTNVATYIRGNVAFSVTVAAGREGAGLTVDELHTIVLGTQARPVADTQSAGMIVGADKPTDIVPTEEQPADAAEAVEAAPAADDGSYVIHYTYSYTDENGTREESGTWNVPLNEVCSFNMQTLINELMNGSQEHFAAPAKPETSAEPETSAKPEISTEPETPAELSAPEAAEAPVDPAVVTSTEYALVISDPFVVDAQHKPVRLVRIGETNMGDFCADAYRVQGGADIGIVDSGAICANINAGEISDSDIKGIFPYGDELCVIEASGQQILDALEWGSRAVPQEFGGFLQVSGLSYEIHDYIPSGCLFDENDQLAGVVGERRVKNVMVGKEPLDPAAIYTVAGPNFLLLENGAGNTAFQGARLLREHVKADTQVLLDYLIDNLNGQIGAEYADPYGQGRIVVFDRVPAGAAQG